MKASLRDLCGLDKACRSEKANCGELHPVQCFQLPSVAQGYPSYNWVLFKVIFYFPNRKSTIWGIYSEDVLLFGNPFSKSKIRIDLVVGPQVKCRYAHSDRFYTISH